MIEDRPKIDKDELLIVRSQKHNPPNQQQPICEIDDVRMFKLRGQEYDSKKIYLCPMCNNTVDLDLRKTTNIKYATKLETPADNARRLKSLIANSKLSVSDNMDIRDRRRRGKQNETNNP